MEASPVPASATAAGADRSEPIDFAAILARVENDCELMCEMCELFLQSSPPLVAEIEAGIARGDGATIERAAHALKGALQNLSAAEAAQAAAGLEGIGRMHELARAGESLEALKHQLNRVAAAIADRPHEVPS